MATDGGFTPGGAFHPLPTMCLAPPIEELLRHRILGMLPRKGLLTSERIRLVESWPHSGFNVNAQVRIGADDAAVCRVAGHIAALPAPGGSSQVHDPAEP